MIELMVARVNTAVETLFRIGGEGPAMARRFREWKVKGFGWIEVSANAVWTGTVSCTTLHRRNGPTRQFRR